MCEVTTVNLSEKGVALILLEQEMRNNAMRLTRLLNRRTQIDDEIALVRDSRRQLEATLTAVKESL